MRRTNRDFADRSITQNFTEEFADTFGCDFEAFESVVREQARLLENSINGVVAVASNDHVVNVRCIHGRDADEDVIRHMVQDMVSKVMRELDDDYR